MTQEELTHEEVNNMLQDELTERINENYRNRTFELKHYKKLIRMIPVKEIKEYGAYGCLIIKEFPSEENDNNYSYRQFCDTMCGGGIQTGDGHYDALTKKEIYRQIDWEIDQMRGGV